MNLFNHPQRILNNNLALLVIQLLLFYESMESLNLINY